VASFECVRCGSASESDSLDPSCPRCGSALFLSTGAPAALSRGSLEGRPAGVWRYRELLPSLATGTPVSLGEGGTPLLRAANLGAELGLGNLLLKDETRNPTGSFIDRGSTVLASLAKERGVESCSCVTTGNLGASLSAYCAKAGIGAEVRIRPSTDRGKLYQMIAYGARIVPASRATRAEGRGGRTISVTAGNPYILEGEKTTCFEIAQDLGWRMPDVVLVPVGTGGHLSMFWRAMEQMKASGLIGEKGCRLLGVQLSGPPLDAADRALRGRGRPAEEPFTELEESEPMLWEAAAGAVKESGGSWVRATAAETIEATGLLARTEGIFAEPAAASVVASLRAAKAGRHIDAGETAVCVITGAGLKDTKAISRIARDTRHAPVADDYPAGRLQLGATKLRLLRCLSPGPSFGYELWKELSAKRAITTASVYQHLAELEGMGLVRKSGVSTSRGRERVLYELTRRGSDLLRMAGRIERG